MGEPQMYQEGGWGWFVALSAFVTDFIIFGAMRAFGVLINAMKNDLDTDLWIIGSIASFHVGVMFILTPVASVITRKVGGRPVVIVGGVLLGLGMTLSSITYSVPFIAFCLILMAGTGAACTNDITRFEMVFYFRDKYAMASSIVYAAAPLGIIVYGSMTQVLLDTYGWRGAMLINGGIGFHLIWAGCLLRRPTGVYAVLPRDEPSADEEQRRDALPSSEQDSPTLPQGHRRRSLVKTLGLDVLCNFQFLQIAGIKMCNRATLSGVLFYMKPNGLSLGLTSWEASFLLTSAFGLGGLGGLFAGAFTSPTNVRALHFSGALAAGLAGVSLALAPLCSSLVSQLVIMGVIGFGIFLLIQCVAVLARFLPFGDDRFVLVLGWLAFLCGIMSGIVDTLSGFLYDVTENFRWTFFLLSGCMSCCVLFLLVDYYICTRCINRADKKCS